MMTRSPYFLIRSGIVGLAVIGQLGLTPDVALAQTTPAATAPQGPVLPLSMSQAEAMALESNLGLKADRLAPDLALIHI